MERPRLVAPLVQGIDDSLYGTTRYGGGLDGDGPYSPLIQTPDGNLYGTTYSGGGTGRFGLGCGTMATDGAFYGTASSGGDGGRGVVFRLACRRARGR